MDLHIGIPNGKPKVQKIRKSKQSVKLSRSLQETIPIQRIYADGIFEVGGTFTKTWRFSDINYLVLSEEEKEYVLLEYSAILNSMPLDAGIKITLANRKMNPEEFRDQLLMKMHGDGLDRYRAEYNDMLSDKMAQGNNLVQDKYITVSVQKKTVEEARTFFQRVSVDLNTGLGRMNSKVMEMSVVDRLRIFHDFFRNREVQEFNFNLKNSMAFGKDFRDTIVPDSLSFHKNYYEMGEQFGRVLFLKDYASSMKDSLITELTDYSRNLILSIDILPIAMDDAVKELQRRTMAVESDIASWQNRQNANYHFSAMVPYEKEQMRQEMKDLTEQVTASNQRLMFALVTLTHVADNLETLNEDTEALKALARTRFCQLASLDFQQEDALNTVLPYGIRKINATRTLTTESTAIMMPFKSQEILEQGGVYYGRNAVSGNLILCNRGNLLNGNGFILGVSGSGKSFAAKQEIVSIALATDHDIIVVDPEGEYGNLIRMLGGEVIPISVGNNSAFINALDINEAYGDGRPLEMKIDFIMSLYEMIMDGTPIKPADRSILKRCTENIYAEYLKNYEGNPPTLKDLYDDLMKQVDPRAKEIALTFELYCIGTLDVFAHQSTVNAQSRIICFDLHELGETLKPIGLLTMLDAILNRVTRNRQQKRYTHVYIDEIYLFFASHNVGGRKAINQYSGEFLFKCWKRFRKYYAMLTGITQNVGECLESDQAKFMFANSEFLLMFNQAPQEREQLGKLLNISEPQLNHITNAVSGQGLIKVGSGMVPLINDFPRHTSLYRLMTTKPGEEL